MRRHPQQHFALGQRLMHQPERVMLEIAQPAMDELGRGRGRAGGEIVLLDQQHTNAAAGGVARNTGSVDAAADNGEIEVGHVLSRILGLQACLAGAFASSMTFN